MNPAHRETRLSPAESHAFLQEVQDVCARVQSPDMLAATLQDMRSRCKKGEMLCDMRIVDFFRGLPQVLQMTRGEAGTRGTSGALAMAAWNQEAVALVEDLRRDPNALGMFWSSFMTAFDRGGAQSDGEKIRTGILGDLGARHLLSGIGYRVVPAKAELDVHYGIDFIANDLLSERPGEERRSPLAVQVKSIWREGIEERDSLTVRLLREGEEPFGDPEATKLQRNLAQLKAEHPEAVPAKALGLLVRLPRLQYNPDGRPQPLLSDTTGEIQKPAIPMVVDRIRTYAPELLPEKLAP